jgi:hypothetical protein
MNLSTKAWYFDPDSRTIINPEDKAVICSVPPDQPVSIVHQLCATPVMTEIFKQVPDTLDRSADRPTSTDFRATETASLLTGNTVRAIVSIANDLHFHLGRSLSALEDEEDSVKAEHAQLIARLDEAYARANAVLPNLDHFSLPPNTLRALAQALLLQAQQADKLVPYVVIHSHRHGETFYTTWSATDPTEKQMAALLEEEYEPERGESLTYNRMAVEDLTGAPLPQAPGTDDDEGEDEEVRPVSM